MEFWEETFKDKQEMWGLAPAKSSVLTNAFFIKHNVKKVLIPIIGYGRYAQTFRDSGMTVTGIEISRTAVDLAKKHYGDHLNIYHGSVNEMPCDNQLYEGIFCYVLIHLLNKEEREKLIQNCYNQLTKNGCMVFTTIAKSAETFGQGNCIGEDQFEMFGAVKMFFYERESIQGEFGQAGL